MKKLLGFTLIAMIFVFSSCDELGLGSLPIDQTFEETFELTIDAKTPSHVGDTVVFDLSELDEFADVTESIDSLVINKIALDIISYDAPEDLYLGGSVFASNDSFESTSITVGDIAALNPFDYFTSSEQIVLELNPETIPQLTSWLTDSKNATVAYDFALMDMDGNDYVFAEEDFGSTVTIKVSVGITAYVSSLPDFGDIGI